MRYIKIYLLLTCGISLALSSLAVNLYDFSWLQYESHIKGEALPLFLCC